MSSTVEPTAESAKPTNVRYTVVGLTSLMAVLLYLDRFCLSFVTTFILDDFDLSYDYRGWLLSAFFWTYALCQVPSGWLTDRFGSRPMLTLYIVLWSVFTGLIGLAESFVLVLVFRGAMGVAQAGAYPTGASMVSKWAPFSARGLFSSIIAGGGRVGGMIAPLLTGLLLIWLVPLDVSSQLDVEDLLTPEGKPKLAQRLQRTEKQKPADQFADKLREMIASQSSVPLADMSDQQLVGALNQILKRKDLYSYVDIQDFKLESQAETLADIPEEELTVAQTERRNRFLLEAAFPSQIGKLYGTSWRAVLLIYGFAGLIVAALFYFGTRSRPEVHPWCNRAEVDLIEQSRVSGSKPHGKVGGVPWLHIMRNRSLWCSSLSQFGTNVGWVFVVLMLPTYLEAKQVPVAQRGFMSMLPLLIGIVGMLNGGWVTDAMTRRFGIIWGRRFPMSMTRFTAMAAFIACMLLDSAWGVTLSLCVVTFSTDLGTSAIWAYKQDVGGRYVGSVLGWGNMWGNLGAAVSPVLVSWIAEPDRWGLGFLTCAAAFLLSGVAALFVDATSAIVPEES